jgi:cytochrome c553
LEPPVRGASSIVLALVLSTSCSKPSPLPPPPPSDDYEGAEGRPEGPGLGVVMVQVGHRFELAGRAAVANRFELAAFEAGELGELFENDVPRASLPKEGPTAQIPAMAKAFLESIPPELSKAATSKDPAAFAAAFEHAAATCNACHQSAEKGFIQVPSVPGRSVPVLDPLPPIPPSMSDR